jgi:hypothetical protein
MHDNLLFIFFLFRKNIIFFITAWLRLRDIYGLSTQKPFQCYQLIFYFHSYQSVKLIHRSKAVDFYFSNVPYKIPRQNQV